MFAKAVELRPAEYEHKIMSNLGEHTEQSLTWWKTGSFHCRYTWRTTKECWGFDWYFTMQLGFEFWLNHSPQWLTRWRSTITQWEICWCFSLVWSSRIYDVGKQEAFQNPWTMSWTWHGCKAFMSNINLRTRAFETINVTVLITLHQRSHIEQPCINYIASIALKKPLIVRLFKHT